MNESLFPDPAPSAAAASGECFTAHCDGGSRGNPGPSGYGAVVEDSKGRVVARLNEYLGIQTNNFAEYSGLLALLHWAIENHAQHFLVVSDSLLMVKQMQGKFAVKSPGLRPLYMEAHKLSRKIEKFEIRHTLRAGNKEADRLANEAMDQGMKKVAFPKVGKPEDFPAALQQVSGVRGASQISRPATNQPASQPAVKPVQEVFKGYVQGGVVRLLEGNLPDGIFVKVVRE
jgi:probable phosphoglycerate mutase